MDESVARWLGIDITTTEMAVAVGGVVQGGQARSGDARDGFASLPMEGATNWNGDPKCPGFELTAVPRMLEQLLEALSADGWRFDEPGFLSLACRQHDMVVLDQSGLVLLPALSWQCNAAADVVEELIGDAFVTEAVGRVEPRFILPKLAYVLATDPALSSKIAHVMTTGDWVLGKLSSHYRLSTSDALSNGLLDQRTRELARDVLSSLGMDPSWFPEVVQSGHEIGLVDVATDGSDDAWSHIQRTLRRWRVVAGLGDNHASALGCGMQSNRTLVVSAGTSGTVNLACSADAELTPVDDPAARFEFYRDNRLLLRMLAYCGDWYNRFLHEYRVDKDLSHEALNEAANGCDVALVQRLECDSAGEKYPADWRDVPPDVQVASVQYSICLELLLHVRRILDEVPAARQNVQQYVLTGGLSQSSFFRRVFATGIELLDSGKAVKVSGRTGPLRYKTSASGAMLNARMPEWQHDLSNMPDDLFPLQPCGESESVDTQLQQKMAKDLGWMSLLFSRTPSQSTSPSKR